MSKARILKGKKTEGHAKWLQDRGYTVTEDDKNIYVECSGFHEEHIDSTTKEGQETLKKIVETKKMMTYQTPVTVQKTDDDGNPTEKKKLSGIHLTNFMGEASALLAHNADAKKKTKKRKPVADAFQL